MNGSSIINLEQRAQSCLSMGQYEEAKSLYDRLCHLDAGNEEHWLTLAALYGETGDTEKALEHANKAIELDDSYVEAYLTRAHLLQKLGQTEEAFRAALDAVQRDDTYDEAMLFLTGLAGQLKRFTDAEEWAEKTLAIQPSNLDALLNLAHAQFELTRYDEAEKTYSKAMAADPSRKDAVIGLAKSIMAQGRHDEALPHLEAVLKQSANDIQAKDLRAACLMNTGRTDQAQKLLESLIRTTPEYVYPYKHLAALYEQRGDHLQAIHTLEKALNETDQHLEILGDLARLYLDYGMPQKAIESCNRALEIEPDNKSARFFLARSLSDSVHYEDALEQLDILAEAEPDSPLILGSKASILEHLGRHEDAHTLIKKVLDSDAEADNIANVYARLCHKFDECDAAIAMMKKVLSKPDLEKNYRRGLLFTLGKLYDRLHDYDAAFEAIDEANRSKPYSYDHDSDVGYINRLVSAEITGLIRKPRIVGAGARHRVNPVFIFGMPRSGTSLVEKIIASHPSVIAGGERHEISSLVAKLPFIEGITQPYPECLTELSQDAIDKMLQAFDNYTREMDPGITVITDKMPENYQHLVFIRMLFPDAPVIHCVRNPADTCLSCYFQQFTGYHDYAYDLEALGKHYNEYKRLMNHYRDVDRIPFLEVQYEDLVHDTEAVTRRMIDYCNLEWDERCLRYYENDDVVRTASYDQVNKPIYTGSIDKWKHYQAHLGPLLDALDTNL